MRARGYLTPIDPGFSVYRSHGDGLGDFLARLQRWEFLKGTIAARTQPRLSHTRLVVDMQNQPQDFITAAK